MRNYFESLLSSKNIFLKKTFLLQTVGSISTAPEKEAKRDG